MHQYLPLLLVCIRLLYPTPLLDSQTQRPEDQARWLRYGIIAVSLIQAQSNAQSYFLDSCYKGKTLSPAFGINWHFNNLTSGHLKGLRQLLLIAGDVEANPGPAPSDETACDICGKIFKEKRTCNEHEKTVHGPKNLSCTMCDYQTSKQSHLDRHIQNHQDCEPKTTRKAMHSCDKCVYTSTKPSNLKRHRLTHDKSQPSEKRRRVEESDEEIQKIVGTTLNQLINRVSNWEELSDSD